MKQRILAITDIHGCLVPFRALLDKLQPQADDVVVILGDCIDRGPDSRGVIEALLQLKKQCQLVLLLGNHEEMMLRSVHENEARHRWLQFGGDATLNSYLVHGEPDPVFQEHIDFIRTWNDFWQCDTHFFVHANYDPQLRLEAQHWEVQRWKNLKSQPAKPHRSGKIAVVGHSAQSSGEVLDLGFLICIDTYCHGNGWLTAMEIPADKPTRPVFWQADLEGKLRPYPITNSQQQCGGE